MALRDQQKDKLRRWIRVTMVFIAILLLFFSVGVPIINNAIALKVENQLKKLPLPPDTELVESTSVAAKIVGNGNGMQYFGAILIKSDLHLNELQTHYEEYDCDVQIQLSPKIGWANSRGPSFRHEDYDDTYFIVYRWGDAPEWLQALLDTDLRGH